MYRRKYVGLLVLIGLCLASCTLASTTSTTTPTPKATSAHFEKGTCQVSLHAGFVDGQNVLCGFLVVPEDRNDPHSATIRLTVATFKTPSAPPAPHPIIFLPCGPGGSVIPDFA